MRRALVPALLLAAAALASGAATRFDPCREIYADHSTFTECEFLKKLFCTKANQIAENNKLNTWQIFDDYDAEYDEHIDKTQGKRYDDSLDDTRRWMYPSQFGRLQRGFQDPYKFDNGRQDESKTLYYGNEPLPNSKMVYLRNKDVLIKNGQTYYVYDTYIGTINPFNFMSARFLCRADDSAESFSDLEQLQTEQINEMNPLVEDAFGKRGDVLDKGQKEVPDNLIFAEDAIGGVRKKLFALWSRMQSLTPKGRQLPARRHAFVLYGRDGALSAETRAARLRPAGQPLRWG